MPCVCGSNSKKSNTNQPQQNYNSPSQSFYNNYNQQDYSSSPGQNYYDGIYQPIQPIQYLQPLQTGQFPEAAPGPYIQEPQVPIPYPFMGRPVGQEILPAAMQFINIIVTPSMLDILYNQLNDQGREHLGLLNPTLNL